jgi:hypothetical protein
VRSKLVVNAMAGEESNVAALVREDLNRRRGSTPRCNRVQGSDRLEAFKLAKASAANDGDMDGLCKSKESALRLE